MTQRRLFLAPLLALLLAVAATPSAAPAVPDDTLPARLSDEEFWKLSQDLSEPNGYFRSDNLVSNEIWFQYTLDDLLKRTRPGGVYLGVGPEQNFTYIAALKPKMVFITDVRRGNLHTHLMYKALFELSADRAEFVSRLFTKPRPASLTTKSSAADLMNAYWDIQTSPEPVYKKNLQDIFDVLQKKHSLPLSKDDLEGIEYVYHSFYWFGPSITYNSSSSGNGRGGGNMVDYATLMMTTDGSSRQRSYLASEETYSVLRELEQRNLFVPVVGNFGGAKALRAVGKYIRERGSFVMAMYLSNVEQYLQQDGIWNNFCGNVASMPLNESSTFIRSASGGGGGGPGGGLLNSLGAMQAETKGCGFASQPVGPDVRLKR
jgi:hypothetical protein